MTTVTSAKAQNPPGSQPDADQCEPVALSTFEAWSQRAKQAATPAAEGLTEQDIVNLVRESRNSVLERSPPEQGSDSSKIPPVNSFEWAKNAKIEYPRNAFATRRKSW